MTHLPYSTDFPKPGDTITAAQANALPVGSRVHNPEWPLDSFIERTETGWRNQGGAYIADQLTLSGYILLRVGPSAPQFAVGQMVTVTQMAALPNRSRVKYDAWSDGFFLEKSSDGWSDQSGRLASSLDGPYRLLRIGAAAPACPHVEGSLAWARWQAREQGKCVQCEGSSLFKFIDGRFHYWAVSLNKWINNNGICGSIEEWPGPWSVVPDPSLPAETPVVHIGPAEACAALDEAIPEWRETMTVGQAVGELNLRIGLYQASEKELREKVEALTAERDRLRLESMNYERECMKALEQRDAREAMLDRFVEALGGIEVCGEHSSNNCPWHVALDRAETLTAERDAAISEIGKSCATMAAAHADEIKGITAERDRLRIENAEWQDTIVSALDDRGANWRDDGLTALQLADAIIRAYPDNLCKVLALQSDIATLEAERDAALARAKQAEARLVVPEGVQKWATYMVQTRADHNSEKRAAAFILSLADHLPETKKKVQSQHPEGTREWAEDAMRAGYQIEHRYVDGAHWVSFVCTDGRKWKEKDMASDGWRIHTPAVAPEPLPSIAQIWARIAAIEERLGDVEAGV